MMATRKASVKRKATRDLKRATTPIEAKEIIEELSKELESQADNFPKGGQIPGVTYGGNKAGYTYQHLCKMFPVVSFTPDETIPLTWNGVSVMAISGLEMHTPKCFKDLYDRHRQAVRESFREVRKLNPDLIIDVGAGPLPSE